MIYKSSSPDVSIPEMPYHTFVLQNVAKWHDDPAFIDAASGRTLTFGQVAEGARRVASSLAAKGFRKGDVFAIFLPNVPEYAVAFHAVAMLGGIVTTSNPLYTADEFAFQLRDTKAKFVLTIAMFADKVSAATKGTSVQEIFTIDPSDGATPFASLARGDDRVHDVAIDPARDLVAIPYSSGTSGKPKGVMLSHRNLVAITRQVEGCLSFGSGDCTIGFLPFFHIYGMVVLMNIPLYRGGRCVTMPRFELEPFLDVIQRHHVTHLYLVPPIVLALAKHPVVEKYDLSSVKIITSGAAPLDEALQSLCAKRVGTPVLQGYGMTESSLAITVTHNQPGAIRAGSAGVLLPNMEARIEDPATGEARGVGERGEICVRGPNVMLGYLNNPTATSETIRDGWLHTGDVGYFDEDGHLFVVDRVKELIKYKGMQVAPAEIEGVLLTNPAIADAAVIPVPDEEAGEIPKAYIVRRGELSADAVMSYVAERVAPHKKVRLVEFVDAIPKSPSGKILRRVLIEKERAAAKS
jgi:acyl-CoA synthetase (AMP-forming)/AMP-acid ligase II